MRDELPEVDICRMLLALRLDHRCLALSRRAAGAKAALRAQTRASPRHAQPIPPPSHQCIPPRTGPHPTSASRPVPHL